MSDNQFKLTAFKNQIKFIYSSYLRSQKDNLRPKTSKGYLIEDCDNLSSPKIFQLSSINLTEWNLLIFGEKKQKQSCSTSVVCVSEEFRRGEYMLSPAGLGIFPSVATAKQRCFSYFMWDLMIFTNKIHGHLQVFQINYTLLCFLWG